ncbi:sodium/potassium-transporting ATPase subunit beta-1-like [Chelonus insularis]|uniref:sodium/potassium-transporting ATPase subunit beta-1-like n=1 Tax=Chelonus insularis TaxID=460826 RepID=UPI00158A4225|nr:sodium/potassium-transporting ATPase subunit beta-1-like [Chelonus insularis]
MIIHDEEYYENRRPVKDLGAIRNFLRFIWDGEKRAFLDRTAKDWATVGLFYLCFFGVLFSLFSLQMWITLDYVTQFGRPYIEQSAFIAKSDIEARFLFFEKPFTRFGYPGLGLIPRTEKFDTSMSFIWLSENQDNKEQYYIEDINRFMKEYNDVNKKTKYNIECVNSSRKYSKDKPCFFDTKVLGKCSENPYGYSKPYEPCVYIKFNKRFDWIPICYNNTSDLPNEMPEDLKVTIKSSTKPHVWLSCDGVTNFDKQHVGLVEYFPERGFPVYYFPFMGQSEYLSPVVALLFKNITQNRLITIECYAWALNILYDRKYALRFQMVIN